MTENDKDLLLNGGSTIPFRINIINDDEIIELTENDIVNLSYEDFRYVDTNSLVVGQFVARKITGELSTINTQFEIEDTELEIKMGIHGTIEGDEVTHWYSLGNFLVTKPTSDDIKDKTTFEALDYAKKFNRVFDDSNLAYPCTARELAQEVCRQCGVELATSSFTNDNFIINNNQYTENDSCRKVMQDIGKLAYSWVRIGWDNKCYVDYSVENEVYDYSHHIIQTNKYYDLNKQDKVFGPVNRVVIGMENIEGENVYVEDPDSIEEYGVTELQIYDNYLTYTPELRQQVINGARRLFGLTYLPLEINTIGHPWLIGKEKIGVVDSNGDTLYTYPFDRTIEYKGHIKTKLTSKSETKIETEYKNTETLENDMRKTRIVVDKQNQTIESVVSNVSEQNTKISQITQTVDELNSKISDIADITISGESNFATFTLDNINESEPIQIKVKPVNESISYLYPHSNLYPSSNLYPKVRKVLFENLTTNEIFEYVLPDDLLYYNNSVYDEFILDYGDGDGTKICQVIKRCQYNADGTVSPTGTEQIVNYPYPTIMLTDGDYKLSLQGYEYGYLFARLMAKNIYTTQFATRVEMNSKISQTTQEINLEVSKKVGNDEIISKINQSAEQISINANKINLNGIVTANENFKILGDGSMVAKNGEFNGSIHLIDDGWGSESDENKSEITITNGHDYINKIWSNGIKLKNDRFREQFTANNNFANISIAPLSSGLKRSELFYDYFNNTSSLRLWGERSIITAIAGDYEDSDDCKIQIYDYHSGNDTTIKPNGITTPTLTQVSLESSKKNIEKYSNALKEIKNTDIYKYNLKSEKDGCKKHIGFVIGEKYKYSKDITSENENKESIGVDLYSMVAVCFKAIQEQQEQIEELKEEINKLKGDEK